LIAETVLEICRVLHVLETAPARWQLVKRHLTTIRRRAGSNWKSATHATESQSQPATEDQLHHGTKNCEHHQRHEEYGAEFSIQSCKNYFKLSANAPTAGQTTIYNLAHHLVSAFSNATLHLLERYIAAGKGDVRKKKHAKSHLAACKLPSPLSDSCIPGS
jgi:hypothetical protein